MTRTRRGMTVIEVVVALSILAIAALALAYSTSTSVAATRGAKPRLIAQQAAQRTIEELRGASQPLVTFYTTHWGSAALSQSGTPQVHLPLDTSTTFNEVLAPALQAGLMGKPADGGAVLRVRFLSEDTYNDLWGTDVDLDFDGQTDGGIQHDGSGSTAGATYRMHAIAVEVHYRDERGEQLYRVVTAIGGTSELDPQRS